MHVEMFFCTKEKMPLVLFILSVFHAEISSETPVQVLVGSNASFSFLLSEEPNSSVVTILDKAGTVVMNARGSLGISSNPIYNYRINFTGNTYQKLISFNLRNITLADAGMYIAVVSFPDKTIGSQMLIVKASPSKPQIVEFSGPGVTGSNYHLNCSAQSNSEPPKHNLSMFSEWRRDNIPISSSGKYIVMGTELTITGLSYIQDNGARFICVAFEDQLAKSVSSDEFIVDVIYGPASVQILLSPSEFPLEVEENKTVNITCSADCNPGCTFRWSGPQGILKTGAQLSQLIDRYKGGNYTCIATNDANLGKTATVSVMVIVLYAPDVSVTVVGLTLQNSTLTVLCEARGHPAEYTFHSWKQMWGDKIIRSDLQGTPNLNHNTLKLERLSLQDRGIYICSVDNNITGIDGKLEQTGAVDLKVTGTPVVLKEEEFNFAELAGHSIHISIPFYSNPAVESFFFEKNGTELKNNTKTSMNLSARISSSMFHGIPVKLEAQMVNLFIQNLTQDDFDNYTLVLRNFLGIKDFKLQLNAAGPPIKVDMFNFIRFVENQIEFHFKPGFNGGRVQTFVIEYKSTASPDLPWRNSSVTDLKETQTPNETYHVNLTQPPSGNYEYRMYSWNELGRSPYSAEITVFIPQGANTFDSLGLPVAGIAGGISAGIVCILVIGIGIFLWRRNRHKMQNEQDNAVTREHKERRNQVKASHVKQDVASGKEYEGLHFTKAEAMQYLQLNDITLEGNRDQNIRSPESDSYEKLHSYANNEIQMYSSLKIPETSNDSESKYENTWMKLSQPLNPNKI